MLDRHPFEHINPEEHEQVAIIGRICLGQWNNAPETVLARHLFGVFLDWIEDSEKSSPSLRQLAVSFAQHDKTEQDFALEMFGHILNSLEERCTSRQWGAALCRAMQFLYRFGLLTTDEREMR